MMGRMSWDGCCCWGGLSLWTKSWALRVEPACWRLRRSQPWCALLNPQDAVVLRRSRRRPVWAPPVQRRRRALQDPGWPMRDVESAGLLPQLDGRLRLLFWRESTFHLVLRRPQLQTFCLCSLQVVGQQHQRLKNSNINKVFDIMINIKRKTNAFHYLPAGLTIWCRSLQSFICFTWFSEMRVRLMFLCVKKSKVFLLKRSIFSEGDGVWSATDEYTSKNRTFI